MNRVYKAVSKALVVLITFFSINYTKTKKYVKKPAYSNFGAKSKKSGQYRIKSTSGHYKRTSKGYTYVNPYYKS